MADGFLNSIVTVSVFTTDPSTATWRTSLGIAIGQWILVSISMVDFVIYTANFVYGLILAFINLKGSQKLMALLSGLIFLALRFLYVPLLMMLIPMDQVYTALPEYVYAISISCLMLVYMILLIFPLVCGLALVFKYKIWRNSNRFDLEFMQRTKKRIKKRNHQNKIANMIIIVPIYNEEPATLIKTVESIVEIIYPSRAIAVYLSFDCAEKNELYQYLMRYLTGQLLPPAEGYGRRTHLVYRGINFIVNRFDHGGKRNTQALTFREVSKAFEGREKGTFVVFIDSDMILHRDCLVEFLSAMEKNKKLIGLTGYISAMYSLANSSSSKSFNPYLFFQDSEYAYSQIFARSFEAALGGVTCLPGALTMVRLTELSKAAKKYFSELDTNNIFNYHRYHLGEDRYLTHLLMEQSSGYSIGFCPSARAKTEAPSTWNAFVKQRRRWLLGAFSNEVFLLSDWRLWLRVPLLIMYKFLDYSSRSAAFLLYIVLFQLIAGTKFTVTQTLIIWSPLISNWLVMLAISVLIRRFKVFWGFPFVILLNPIINFVVNIYAIFTWNIRTWGGPRTDDTKESALSIVSTTIPPALLELRQRASEQHYILPIDQGYDSAGSSSMDSNYTSIGGISEDYSRAKSTKAVLRRNSNPNSSEE